MLQVVYLKGRTLRIDSWFVILKCSIWLHDTSLGVGCSSVQAGPSANA